ncbi:hypothetical protein [Helicobacter turcicus]|nr:hypothetical protein [Helicobacter turcicus]
MSVARILHLTDKECKIVFIFWINPKIASWQEKECKRKESNKEI